MPIHMDDDGDGDGDGSVGDDDESDVARQVRLIELIIKLFLTACKSRGEKGDDIPSTTTPPINIR